MVAASIVASLVSLVFPPTYVGLLGVLPIVIGVKKLFDLRKSGEEDETAVSASLDLSNVISVAVVTVANGGDNIGIYTPVFAISTSSQIGIFVAVFMVMVALWLAFAHWLVNHPSIGAPIRRFGHVIVPFVLIAIGGFVLYEAGRSL